MTAFTQLESACVVLPNENIDTDQIIPARFLSTTTRKGLGEHAFSDWRRDASGQPRAEFPFNQPHNAGRKGWQAGGRSVQTQFRKGQMAGQAARNYKPIGSLRINADGYLERKVTDAHPVPARRWVGVHRLVWEAAHGPVPRSHVVRFRAGMFTNVLEEITLDRLELISRAEHARRNHPVSRDPEYARLVQLKGAITRQVNRIAREHKEHSA